MSAFNEGKIDYSSNKFTNIEKLIIISLKYEIKILTIKNFYKFSGILISNR
jgi:hypothetical protein